MEWESDGDVTKEELVEIYKRDNGKCVYCGEPVNGRFNKSNVRGFDHIIPRVFGGKHTASNIVVCCRSCNINKSIKETKTSTSMITPN